MKNLTLLCYSFILVALSFTACTPDQEMLTDISTEDALIQTGDLIEENATYEEFLEMNENSELYTSLEKEESLSKELSPNYKNNICTVCNPNIYNISVYNLGGYDRGFGVSGGRNHPCSYQIFWGTGAGEGYTVNWTSGGFASMTFSGPGTYDVWVNLKSGTGGSSCIVADYVTVTIP